MSDDTQQRERCLPTTAIATADNANFAKFCRACPGLIDRRRVDNAQIDLCFTRAKSKAARRLDYGQFLDALAMLAHRKFPTKGDVGSHCIQSLPLARLFVGPLTTVCATSLTRM